MNTESLARVIAENTLQGEEFDVAGVCLEDSSVELYMPDGSVFLVTVTQIRHDFK